MSSWGWVLPGVGVWALLIVAGIAFAKAWAREMARQDHSARRDEEQS